MPKITKTKNTELIDYRKEVLDQMNANANRASKAVGVAAVGMVVKQMQSGYGKPIRRTGDLMRDVNYEAEDGETKYTISIGNSLDYAKFIHEGTSRIRGRAYIRDALMNGWGRLQKIWAAYLKEGY